MTILWIPHSPFQPGSVRRDQHLIRHLKDRHRIISVTWEAGNESVVQAFRKGLQFYKATLEDGRTAYHVRRLPDVTRRFRDNKRDALWLNEWMFQRDIRHIVEAEEIDVLVVAYSAYMTGFPPFDLDIPIVFDYLDCAKWKNPHPPERPYIEQADAVFAVSALAEEQARQLNENVHYIPNGADVAALQKASGAQIRREYGIGTDAPLVSLIGLMDSPYFLEAVQKAKEDIPGLKCLLVGKSEALVKQLSAMPNAEDTFIYVGPVPYEDVASFFAASDVGLYPVPGISYDDGRSPIKVFEYTAAGKPVVSPPIREVRRLDLNNVVYADPNAEAFAEGIVRAFRMESPYEPKISKYDWHHLATQFEKHLKALT